LLLPSQSLDSPLPLLLAWFAVPLVFGAWNALLARYAYAAGDTRQPLRCELLGSLVNVLLLGALPFMVGLAGIPLAALAGVICTALLLMQRQALLDALPWARHWLLSALLLGLAALLLFPVPGVWLQLGLSTLAGAGVMLGMGLWLKPWRKA
ncbi:lipid II flippase MurJ, partial [Pseudomonas sp. UBA4034]